MVVFDIHMGLLTYMRYSKKVIKTNLQRSP
jgi:hypothetical protein